MLQNLHVKNLALIEEADVEFGEGLNILSGETGAGKSIIIGSINMALGEKAPKEMLRKNADYALVELIFYVKNKNVLKQLKDMGIEIENDNLVVISRKIKNGRAISRVNGETTSATKVKQIASLLIDIHGQHEHQSLLNKKKHIEILDEFAKNELGNKKEKLAEVFSEYKKIITERENCNLNSEDRKRELSFLEFEVNEIEEANLVIGEDEELENKYKLFLNGKKIAEHLGSVKEITSGDVSGASEMLDRAMYEIQIVSEYDDKVADLANELMEINNLLSDFNHDLSGYMADMDFDEGAFYEIDKRLNLINRLKSKYGKTIDEILESLDEKSNRIEMLRDYDEYIAKLDVKIREKESELKEICQEVSDIRKNSAKKLTKAIKNALLDLNFLDVKFEMNFKQTKEYTSNGFDDAEFMISTNPGEPVRPLGKVASGGELSRIMLAIKTVMAQGDEIETLIFDEIDSGISGRTAQMVSEKMDILGASHQIICITHLPQIAAMANNHYLIEKSVQTKSDQSETTVSRIHNLDYEQSVEELARMLGGVEITDTVLQNAREMKELAAEKKQLTRKNIAN